MSESTILRAHEVSRTYREAGNRHAAVSQVSVSVSAGEFVALVGPSGCGKSTLLNILGGIDRPDSGEVWAAGTRIDHLSETALALFRRKHVGIVFQFFNLIHNLDVLGNVELPAHLGGESGREARRRSLELLESLDIGELAGKMPSQLSGGQRQRVAIARALINRPSVLLADEPTGALDQEAGAGVIRLFRRLHAQGQTIVLVTHDPKVAAQAERVLLMQDGTLVDEVHPGARPGGRLAEQFPPPLASGAGAWK
ncbi:MAG: transporter ATP-binding protein [Symbiobacteriaceae bacterium]|jgi:putative ABC transport system ATP-binding protein|nr:transporter ATP-binding protein [Symbiobacteriaceae bacterium]